MIGDILQPTHLLFILAVALLVLGPKRLPEVGRALGRGLRDFRNALNTDDLREQMISTTSTQSITEEPPEPSAAPVSPAETSNGVGETPPESSSDNATTTSDEPTAPAEPAAAVGPAPDRIS